MLSALYDPDKARGIVSIQVRVLSSYFSDPESS